MCQRNTTDEIFHCSDETEDTREAPSSEDADKDEDCVSMQLACEAKIRRRSYMSAASKQLEEHEVTNYRDITKYLEETLIIMH